MQSALEERLLLGRSNLVGFDRQLCALVLMEDEKAVGSHTSTYLRALLVVDN